ncbi:MAG: O-antigen ligase family protein [Nitrospirota bacterium]|nr:O-antigen ligase family protein [Nitrospirota bacterium]
MRNLTKIILFTWFLFIVFEAPLRFVFFKTSVPYFIYMKDLLLFSLFLVFIFNAIYQNRINKVILLIFLFLAYGIAIGYINKLSILQILFGFKVFLSFFAGFIAVYSLKVEERFFLKIFRVFVPIIIFGLILEYLHLLPWKGFKYELLGFSIEASRQWSTFGVSRLSGFGRASFETAFLLFSLSVLYIVISYKLKSELKLYMKFYDYLLLALSFVGITLTTSKTVFFAFLIFIFFFVLIKIYDRVNNIPKLFADLLSRVLLFALFLVGIIPPVFALLRKSYLPNGFLHSHAAKFLFGSYIERIEYMWPNAVKLLSGYHMFFTGRGLGGIGAAQKYFEANIYNAADNLYVYLFVDFGFIVLIIFIFYLLYNLLFLKLNNKENIYFFVFCLIIFSCGATLNVIESPTLMMTLGILFGLWKRSVTSHRQV